MKPIFLYLILHVKSVWSFTPRSHSFASKKSFFVSQLIRNDDQPQNKESFDESDINYASTLDMIKTIKLFIILTIPKRWPKLSHSFSIKTSNPLIVL